MSFTTVTAGNQTLASDINQYANSLNGTTAGSQLTINGGNNTSDPYKAFFSQVPAANAQYANFYVTGDASYRFQIALLPNGYTSLLFGNATGGANTNLYAISGGLQTDNNMVVQGQLTVNGGLVANTVQSSSTTTSTSMTLSGNLSVGGTTTMTGAATAQSTLSVTGAATLSGGGTSQGHNIAQVIGGLRIFVQTTAPTSGFSDGDLWFKG